jgi:hypothetical protein
MFVGCNAPRRYLEKVEGVVSSVERLSPPPAKVNGSADEQQLQWEAQYANGSLKQEL